MSDLLTQLLALSHQLGREDRRLAILGEGNTSARHDKERFLVKASGSSLGTLRPEDVVECYSQPLLALFNSSRNLTDQEVDAVLLSSRVDPHAKKPSVEAIFHACLLDLEDVRFVGHTHPVAANGLLCSPLANSLASTRLFPDEVVCCGPESVLVPYEDPGLVLARAIRDSVGTYLSHHGESPRVILLQNHGVITLGRTPQAVEAAMLMCEKAASIRLAAAASGEIITMTQDQVDRILHRPDEHERRRVLKI